MRTFSHLLAASSLSCLVSSSAITPREYAFKPLEQWKRASPEAPNGYAPDAVDCPSTRPSIRVASRLSNEETEWLKKRRPNTVRPMRELLSRLNIGGFDAGRYIDSHRDNTTALPNIGIAFSGGGYRAMTTGAGLLAAFDSRTQGSTDEGHIGGLLQSATYVAGLSGGGWLVGSIYANNFTSVEKIVDRGEDSNVWQLGRSILEGPEKTGFQPLDSAGYYANLVNTVLSKQNAFNFNVSLTDYWSRALSFQLVDANEGGPGYTYSSIQGDSDFKDGNAPMPILLADERAPGEKIISLNATNVEFNPFEMGSFDPTLYGFVPLKYLGSNFTGGRLPDNEGCIMGFDNLGFVMGTSSSLFNVMMFQVDSLDVPQIFKDGINRVLGVLGDDNNDIADYTPNPFFHFNNDTNPSAQLKRLTLVDGGEDLQNIPFNPLIQPLRAVDVIFAADASGDTVPPTDSAQNWPNGTALVATYERSTNTSIQNGTAFPAIPDQNTFVNLGLNNKPTFFGCDAGNATSEAGTAPLIVYLPNAPYVYTSNTSTMQMDYNITERNAMILNGYNVATQGNGTRDEQWPACVGCAILARSFDRTGTQVPDTCRQCFDRYCWNGTLAKDKPAPYVPQMILSAVDVKSGAGQFAPNILGFVMAAIVSAYFAL